MGNWNKVNYGLEKTDNNIQFNSSEMGKFAFKEYDEIIPTEGTWRIISRLKKAMSDALKTEGNLSLNGIVWAMHESTPRSYYSINSGGTEPSFIFGQSSWVAVSDKFTITGGADVASERLIRYLALYCEKVE